MPFNGPDTDKKFFGNFLTGELLTNEDKHLQF
ncbi:MAG: hypothetical protein ACJATN_002484, partial [Neolewinella sp.]